MKLWGKMVKLSTDVRLPPKLPPSESDRKDEGSIKIGGSASAVENRKECHQYASYFEEFLLGAVPKEPD